MMMRRLIIPALVLLLLDGCVLFSAFNKDTQHASEASERERTAFDKAIAQASDAELATDAARFEGMVLSASSRSDVTQQSRQCLVKYAKAASKDAKTARLLDAGREVSPYHRRDVAAAYRLCAAYCETALKDGAAHQDLAQKYNDKCAGRIEGARGEESLAVLLSVLAQAKTVELFWLYHRLVELDQLLETAKANPEIDAERLAGIAKEIATLRETNGSALAKAKTLSEGVTYRTYKHKRDVLNRDLDAIEKTMSDDGSTRDQLNPIRRQKEKERDLLEEAFMVYLTEQGLGK